MKQSTSGTPQLSQQLEMNESSSQETSGRSMQPPQFGLAAGEANGNGAGGGQRRPQHNGFKGTPYESEVAEWQGEVVMIHSPCYSQEIEAAAMAAAGKPEQYEAAASTITSLINECKGKEFENAEGVKNDWADRMLGGSVKMNECNLAATSNGKSGWPKLVILTFWNDPSKPMEGGFNYTHLIYFPFDELLPEPIKDMMPGGSILMGDGGGGIDLGHHAKSSDINEWLPILKNAMNTLAGMGRDPKSFSSHVPKVMQRLQKLAEDAEKILNKVQDTNKAAEELENEGQQKETVENEKWVEIGGQRFERGKTYTFKTFDPNHPGMEGSITCTPEMYLNMHYKNGSRLLPGQGQ